MVMPMCDDIDAGLASNYDNITYVRTIERDGEYIVAVRSEPFFGRSEKIAFVNSVKDYMSSTFSISPSNIEVVFDMDILHLIRHAKSRKDIDNIFKKVS